MAVGGSGLIPFLKAYEQAKGPIHGKKFIGNLFWGTPGLFESLRPRVAGAYVGGAGTAGDLATPAAQDYANNIIGKWFKTIPPAGAAAPQAASTFTYGYYINTWGLLKGLKAVNGDISGGQKKLQAAIVKSSLPAPYGTITARPEPSGDHHRYYQQLYLKNGKSSVKTWARCRTSIRPSVDVTTRRRLRAELPGLCQRSAPWQGKEPSCQVLAGARVASPAHPRCRCRSSACGGSAGASGASLAVADVRPRGRPGERRDPRPQRRR